MPADPTAPGNGSLSATAQTNRLSPDKRFSFGFTLLELILVLLLITILSVTALPRFTRSGFTEQTLASELVSQLRLTQLKNMHSGGDECYQVTIDTNYYYTEKGCSTITTLTTSALPSGVTVTTGSYRFDTQGKPENSCSGGCTITISKDETVSLTIESEGYVHE